MAKKTPEVQSDRQFRRAWFRGVRRQDVDLVIAELETELAHLAATNHALTERVTAAEGTLEVFEASIRNMGTILALAEEHAKMTRETAEGEAERIRAEAHAQRETMRAEIGELLARKEKVMDSILAIRLSLETLGQADPRVDFHPPPPTSSPTENAYEGEPSWSGEHPSVAASSNQQPNSVRQEAPSPPLFGQSKPLG